MAPPSPEPAEHLVFDGDCGFCTRSARWAERYLPATVSVSPWQETDLVSLKLTPGQVETAAYWVDRNLNLYRGHRAVGIVCRSIATQCHHTRTGLQPGANWAKARRWFTLWAAAMVARLASFACLVPPLSLVARGLYRVVATYRHRLPGSTDACRISRGGDPR